MRTYQTIEIAGLAALALLLVMFSAGCEKTDGALFEGDLGHLTCETSADCGTGSFCDAATSACMVECTANRDCYFMDDEIQAAWEAAKAQGLTFDEADLPPLNFKCSDCGGCIPVDQEEDPRCIKQSTSFCTDDKSCQDELGGTYVCGSDGYCTLPCNNDEECGPMDRGHRCAADPEDDRKLCYRYCYDDSSCAFHGYQWRCDLPEDVDPVANFFGDAETTVLGRCIPREEGIDWGEHVDDTKESAKFVGIYGAINETTFTNCGFPLVNCQDSTNIHHQLIRIRQTENGIEIDGKYCYHQALNFRADEDNPTLDDVSDYDDLAWMEYPADYTLAIAYHHWTAEPESAEVGKSLQTSHYLELRGALLDDPVNDPLPTRDDLTGNWDQDRDSKPGVTTVMNGILTGEIYNANRADQYGIFDVAQTDEEGRVTKMQGLLYTENESVVLGASDPTYAVDVEPNLYVDPERSYIRFMRLPDDATCLDVIQLGRSEENCGINRNELQISVDNDTTYLCHTPTLNGPEPTE